MRKIINVILIISLFLGLMVCVNAYPVSRIIDNTLWKLTGTDVELKSSTYNLGIDGNLTVDTNTLFVNSDNNRIGIGTNDPQTNLHINELSNDIGVYIRFDANRSFEGGVIGSNDYYWNGTRVAMIRSITGPDTTNKDDGQITFWTSEGGTISERMRIDENGNVGIGTTNPIYTLHTYANSSGFTSYVENVNSAGEGLRVKAGANSDSYTSFVVENSDGTGLMRIRGNGKVGIGTNSPSTKLHVAGDAYVTSGIYMGAGSGNDLLDDSSGGSGSVTYYIGNAAIQVSSDERIKENISNSEMDALGKINKLRVVDFNWNDPSDVSINNRNARGEWTGLIAQEVVDVLPFVVNAPRPKGKEIDYESEEIWKLEPQNMVPVLVKGIQEQQRQIDMLTERIEALEAKE